MLLLILGLFLLILSDGHTRAVGREYIESCGGIDFPFLKIMFFFVDIFLTTSQVDDFMQEPCKVLN